MFDIINIVKAGADEGYTYEGLSVDDHCRVLDSQGNSDLSTYVQQPLRFTVLNVYFFPQTK